MSETHNLKKLQYDGKEIVAEVANRDTSGKIIKDTYVDKTTDQTITGRKRFDVTPQIFDHYEITSKNLFRKNFNIFDNIGGTGTTYAYFKLPDDGKNYTLSVRLKDSTKSFGNGNVFGYTQNGGTSGGSLSWLAQGDKINSQYHVFYPNDNARCISLFHGNADTFNKLLDRYYIQLEEGTTMTEYIDPDSGIENIYVDVAKVNDIPTKTSELTNDSDFATHADLDNYVTTNTAQTITARKTFTTSAYPVARSMRFYLDPTNPSGNYLEVQNDNGYNGKVRFGGKGLMFTAGHIYPSENNNSQDLGSSSYKFRDFYLARNLSDGTNSITVADIASKAQLDNYVDLTTQQRIDGLKIFDATPVKSVQYTKLEYVESTNVTSGNFTCFNSGVYRTKQYSTQLTCVIDGYFLSSQQRAFFGYDSGGQLGQSNGYWSVETNTSTVSALERKTITQVLDFTAKTDTLYYEGNPITSRAIGIAMNLSLQGSYGLFVAFNGQYAYQPCNFRLYSLKMYSGDYIHSPETCTLIRDYIGIRTLDNQIALLDLVENEIYYNSGNKDLEPGPDVTADEILLPFLNAGEVATVALTGSYNNLSDRPNIPTVGNGTLTIKQNDSTVATFTANQSASVSANITVPTSTSDLINDSGFITNATELGNILSAISGYDSTKIQTLKNINGTFMWVDDN